MALQHQYLCLKNGLIAQWQVNSHLVTVEVGVERSTCQRMELDSLTLDELRLECLDRQTVKCRRTVQENRMTLHDILQDVPDYWLTAVNDFLCALYRLHDAALNKLSDDEWFVKLRSHLLWQTYLTHIQLGTHNDNRTARIVNTLTKQVLAETSLLSL